MSTPSGGGGQTGSSAGCQLIVSFLQKPGTTAPALAIHPCPGGSARAVVIYATPGAGPTTRARIRRAMPTSSSLMPWPAPG